MTDNIVILVKAGTMISEAKNQQIGTSLVF